MNRLLPYLVGVTLMASGIAYGVVDRLPQERANDAIAPCLMAAGQAYDKLTITTSDSSILEPRTVFCLSCAGDAWYEFGDGAAPTADTLSHDLWAKQEVCFRTGANTGISDYLGVVSQTGAADTCKVRKCE